MRRVTAWAIELTFLYLLWVVLFRPVAGWYVALMREVLFLLDLCCH